MPAPDSRHLVVAFLLALQAAAPPGHGPGAQPPGFNAATFDPLVEDGIRRGAFPGAVLVVGRRDTVLFAKGYGRFTWSPAARRPDPDSTIWDLASITKVVGTTTALMILVERGAVRLDTPVVAYIPGFHGAGTAPITVRHLLTHTSGLRPTLPLREAPDAAAALQLVLATTPTVPPGTRVVYSDLNAILLGEIVRRRAGEPLQAFVTREVLRPLGMEETMYLPPRSLRPRIVPTNLWRGHPIAGEVNDPSAHKLGGVAGHAGLFGTGADLARFARFVLARGITPDRDRRRLIRAETVDAFTALAIPARGGASARGLGWQALPTDEAVSSAGTLFGPRSFGHTGWTGTSLWIDPDRDLFVILLTNRAFAPRTRTSFTVLKQVRGAVADAAARALDRVDRRDRVNGR